MDSQTPALRHKETAAKKTVFLSSRLSVCFCFGVQEEYLSLGVISVRIILDGCSGFISISLPDAIMLKRMHRE